MDRRGAGVSFPRAPRTQRRATRHRKAGIAEYWIVDAKKEIVERYLNEYSAYAIEAIYGVGDSIASDFFARGPTSGRCFFSHREVAKALGPMLEVLRD